MVKGPGKPGLARLRLSRPREVAYGSFERTIKLPGGTNPDEIKASYNNGVLELTMPLPEQSRTRRVPIQLAEETRGSSEVKS